MRISTAFQTNSLEANVQMTASRLYDAQQQVSTGRRINKLSDDPVGLAKSLSLKTVKASLAGFTSNLHTAKGVLGFTDQALQGMNDLVGTAYQAALQGANSTTDQNARNALAANITQIQARLVDLGNAQGPSGQYLFAGQKNDTPPYSVGPTGITYAGDNRSVIIPTDATSTMVVNTPGEPMISNLYNQLTALKNDLIGGSMSQLSGPDVANMQAAQTQLTAARGAIGTKIQSVDTLTSQFAQRTDELTAGISDIEEVDMSSAILKYQQAQNAYQAALTVSGQGFKLNLMNFIAP
jgi:flagellar hook-associated protein 3 FlgL